MVDGFCIITNDGAMVKVKEQGQRMTCRSPQAPNVNLISVTGGH